MTVVKITTPVANNSEFTIIVEFSLSAMVLIAVSKDKCPSFMIENSNTQ